MALLNPFCNSISPPYNAGLQLEISFCMKLLLLSQVSPIAFQYMLGYKKTTTAIELHHISAYIWKAYYLTSFLNRNRPGPQLQ